MTSNSTSLPTDALRQPFPQTDVAWQQPVVSEETDPDGRRVITTWHVPVVKWEAVAERLTECFGQEWSTDVRPATNMVGVMLTVPAGASYVTRGAVASMGSTTTPMEVMREALRLAALELGVGAYLEACPYQRTREVYLPEPDVWEPMDPEPTLPREYAASASPDRKRLNGAWHALGTELHGDNWDLVRPQLVGSVLQRLAPPKADPRRLATVSTNALTDEQLDSLVQYLRSKKDGQ